MKEKLIIALQKERDTLSKRGVGVADHDVTIQYLKDGTLPRDHENYKKYEILDAVRNDFDCVCSDYGITE